MRPLRSLVLILFALAGPAAARAVAPVYVALGDSIAFGQVDQPLPSYGDQGYVKPFADWLAGSYGGVRPEVVNLAISGETSGSFLTGAPPPGWTSRYPLANLHYTSPPKAQFAMFQDTVAAQAAAGNPIDTVSFALGANDLFYLVSTPAFQNPAADRDALAAQMLAQVRSNYVAFLDAFRQELPNADLYLLNYYNPLGYLGPNDPLNQFALGVYAAHSAMVQDLAGQYGGRFVDIYTPFVGHEQEYTGMRQFNPHPNAAGYAVIARQMEAAAAIPEPGTLVLLAAGGLLLVRRRLAL